MRREEIGRRDTLGDSAQNCHRKLYVRLVSRVARCSAWLRPRRHRDANLQGYR